MLSMNRQAMKVSIDNMHGRRNRLRGAYKALSNARVQDCF
jgi:hypothetical protein